MEFVYRCPRIAIIGISWGGAMISSTARGRSCAATPAAAQTPAAAGTQAAADTSAPPRTQAGAPGLPDRAADPGPAVDTQADAAPSPSERRADPAAELHRAIARLLASRHVDGRHPAGDLTDLDAVIGYARQRLRDHGAMADSPLADGRVADSPMADHLAAGLRTVLGLALADRFDARVRREPGDPTIVEAARADRDEAIAELAAVLPGADVTSWRGVATALGRLRHQRASDRWAGATAEPGDLDSAVSLLSRVARSSPGDQDGPGPEAVRSLVPALWDKYTLSSDDADRDELIAWAQVLLDMPGTEDDAVSVHDLLGLVLLDRAQASLPTRRADLTAAIRHLEAVLAATPPASPGRASLVALLADACWRLIDGQASSAEVDKMTRYAQEAWRLQQPDEPVRAELALYLAVGLHERLRQPDQPTEAGAVSSAIDALTQAEPLLAAEPDSRALAMVLLGHFLIARAQGVATAPDLTVARQWILLAAEKVPAEDPRWSDITQTLAGSMSVLALADLLAGHLDRAISFLSAVARRSGPQPDHAALIRNALGVMLTARAGLNGSEQDLDDGIAHLVASWRMIPADEIARIAVATRVGSALLTRFTQRGDSQDVESAQIYLATARDLAADHDDLRSLMAEADITLASIRGLLGLVRGLHGDLPALDEAVVSLRAAMVLLPPDHPHRARIRNDLGLALTMRAIHGVPQGADLAKQRARRPRRSGPPPAPILNG
jgi:hypothetical protein